MKLEAVASYIDSKGLGVEGLTIFVNRMPAECKQGILLMDAYAGTMINHYLPGHLDTGFRVVVRSVDYLEGRDLGYQLLKELTIQKDTVMKDITVRQMLPVNEPNPYLRSAGGYWEFEMDVDIVYHRIL